MGDLKVARSKLPAGGGKFELERLTIGVFQNDQPSHRIAMEDGIQKVCPLKTHQGWILPPGASGICEYDDPLDIVIVEIAPRVLTEVGMPDSMRITPFFGELEPLTRQMAMDAEKFCLGGTIYRETMHRALAVQLTKALRTTDSQILEIEDIRLRRVVEYIHDNLVADLSLKSMSQIAAMSGYHFSRAFKRVTGKSPLQYVISERIALAKVLLKSKSLTVSEVCFQTGYHDLSRFGKHFKRITGQTPSEFRKC